MAQGGPTAALRLLCALFLLVSAGCSLHSGEELVFPPSGPSRVEVVGVPFFPQEQFQCGPASLAMTLTWSGVPVHPVGLRESVYTPSKQGSLQTAMVASARRHGRVAYELDDPEALMTELAAGHPVIVLVNLGLSVYPVWHYAVAVGYDRESGEVILFSGETMGRRYSLRTMNSLWARSGYWGLLTMPPTRLPASAAELTWLKSVVGLERAGQQQAAHAGYRTATERWPQSHDAWVGLGNASYALGRKDEAAAALGEAVRLRPDDGIAANNLAHVLSEIGQHQEAIAAARQAVAIGGPHEAVFRKTLGEVTRAAEANR